MIEKTFSKIEVACQQLDTAIKLWFKEENPISIHTLVCSAHQIISDVIHHQSRNDPLFDSIYIKNGFKKIAKTHFHKYYNLFKHANKDPETYIKFNPTSNEYFISCSIFALEVVDHPNQDKYPGQKIATVKIGDYAYLVPYEQEGEEIFLKTIIPSRKATNKYVRGKK